MQACGLWYCWGCQSGGRDSEFPEDLEVGNSNPQANWDLETGWGSSKDSTTYSQSRNSTIRAAAPPGLVRPVTELLRENKELGKEDYIRSWKTLLCDPAGHTGSLVRGHLHLQAQAKECVSYKQMKSVSVFQNVFLFSSFLLTTHWQNSRYHQENSILCPRVLSNLICRVTL